MRSVFSLFLARSPQGLGRGLAAVAVAAAALAAGPCVAADPWDSPESTKPSKPAVKPAAPAKPVKPEAKPSLKEQGKAVFAKDPTGGGSGGGGWTIALVAFRGDTADESGRLGLHKVQTEGGLAGAFVEHRGDAVVICYGHFDGPDTPEAAQEIKRIQTIEIGGRRPYADAVLSPPMNATNLGAMPQFNLLQAKAALGEQALYTLQVAVYGRRDLVRPTEADLAEGRKAAEIAVVRLRQEGEQAYYYHGQRMSMVTVGTFGIEDFDPQTPSYKSTRLIEAQRRHPYNLYNGAGIKELSKGGRLQPSNLVAVPEK